MLTSQKSYENLLRCLLSLIDHMFAGICPPNLKIVFSSF